MRPIQVFVSCLVFTSYTNAEAFRYSAGWSPGQTTEAAPNTPVPTAAFQPGPSRGEGFSWSSILTSGPIGNLFARSGINITEKLAEARRKANDLPWDERIPMIRDDNYEELIFNEKFATPEEEEARVWFLVVTVTSNQQSGVSAIVDKQFNEAYNISLAEQDLPHVRWGRIDYLNVTRLTTKWAVWRAPSLIVAKDRGKTLRFFLPHQLSVKGPALHDFLVKEIWARREPWSGPWAPGGSREELLDKFAIVQEKLYNYMAKVPRWMYLILSGGIGSLLLNIFHRKPVPVGRMAPQPEASKAPAVEPQKEAAAVAQPMPASGMKKESIHKRKGAKK